MNVRRNGQKTVSFSLSVFLRSVILSTFLDYLQKPWYKMKLEGFRYVREGHAISFNRYFYTGPRKKIYLMSSTGSGIMYIFISSIRNFFVTEVTIVSECLLLKRVTLSCHLVRFHTYFLIPPPPLMVFKSILVDHTFSVWSFGQINIFFFLKIAFNLPLLTDTSKSFVVAIQPSFRNTDLSTPFLRAYGIYLSVLMLFPIDVFTSNNIKSTRKWEKKLSSNYM